MPFGVTAFYYVYFSQPFHVGNCNLCLCYPIQSINILVMKQIGLLLCGHPILLITHIMEFVIPAKIWCLYFHSTSCILAYIVQFHIQLYNNIILFIFDIQHCTFGTTTCILHSNLHFEQCTLLIQHLQLFWSCCLESADNAIFQHATFCVQLQLTSNCNPGKDNIVGAHNLHSLPRGRLSKTSPGKWHGEELLYQPQRVYVTQTRNLK